MDVATIDLWRRRGEDGVDERIFSLNFDPNNTEEVAQIKARTEAELGVARGDGYTAYLIGGQDPTKLIELNERRQFDPERLPAIGVINPGEFDPTKHGLV